MYEEIPFTANQHSANDAKIFTSCFCYHSSSCSFSVLSSSSMSLSLPLFSFSFLFSSQYPHLLFNNLPTLNSFSLNCQNSFPTLTNHCKKRPATLNVTSNFSLFNVISLSRSPKNCIFLNLTENSCPEFKKYLPINFILLSSFQVLFPQRCLYIFIGIMV